MATQDFSQTTLSIQTNRGEQLQSNNKISLQHLDKESYNKIICYPKYTLKEFKQRLGELERLHVNMVEFIGPKKIYNIPVLGKGCVGIVIAAYRKDKKVALKIRRTDADRVTMQNEAKMLQKANKISVGPQFLGRTKNFLLMEYVKGKLLPEWINTIAGKGAKTRLRGVLQSVLEQAWSLDNAGLDHGELSHAPKHVIVMSSDKPCIVDFETASTSRQVSNVTSLSQYFFIKSQIAKLIHKKIGVINENELISTLRIYKSRRTRRNFEAILTKCGLQ